MSTLKSSSDHLTINADGASKNILFQANGVQKASISSAGAFTSTTIDATALTGALSFLSGGELTTGSDAAHDFNISALSCMDTAKTKVCTVAALTAKAFDANFAEGSSAGGMATGISLPASGTVHFFVAEKNAALGTFDIIGDTSVTMANGVSGWTMRRRIASRITDGSNNFLASTQNGDEVLLSVPINSFATTNPGTSAVTQAMSTPAGIETRGIFNFWHLHPTLSAGEYLLITAIEQADTAAAAGAQSGALHAGNDRQNINIDLRTNTSSQIRYRVSVSDSNVQVWGITFGWIDTRGKDD